MSFIDSLFELFKPQDQKLVSPIPESQMVGKAQKPQVMGMQTRPPVAKTPQVTGENVMRGFKRFSNPPPPAATLSAQLAEAGQDLPDPFLPAILTLMETGGLHPNKTATPNNLFNVGPSINYPTPEASILGGGERNQLGLKGLLRPGGLYDDYLQSGNLADFFNHFTPPGEEYGNPSMEELMDRYNSLRSLFL